MARGRALLSLLLEEQDYRCFYCKDVVEDPTVDHVFPRSGKKIPHHVTNGFMNKVAACHVCNARKSNRQPTEEEIERLLVLKRQRTDEADHGDWLKL